MSEVISLSLVGVFLSGFLIFTPVVADSDAGRPLSAHHVYWPNTLKPPETISEKKDATQSCNPNRET